ncbi:MAG: hypothetical protein ISF22_06340 [Methanomassiliicoccus sp.]|nr:hypothetical protein [Methanomassiliicoccus sp.]
MPEEVTNIGAEDVARIAYHAWVKVLALFMSIFLAGLPLYILLNYVSDPLSYMVLAAFIFFLILGAVVTLATFTTQYLVDSVGIRQCSVLSKKRIRWDEVIWISPGDEDGITVLSSKYRLEFDPRLHSGLPFLVACLRAKVPEYAIGAEKQVSSFSEDYEKIESGTSKRWIDFKYYSPLLIMFLILSGGTMLKGPITGEVPWNGASIGLVIALPLIVGLLLYLRKKYAS